MDRAALIETSCDPAPALPRPDEIRLDAEGEARVQAWQIDLAARGLVGGCVIHMALAILLVPLLAGGGRLDAFALTIWAGVLVLAALLRLSAAFLQVRRSSGDLRFGKASLIVTGLLVGAAWGALPVLFFSGEGYMEDILIVFVLGGVALGALTVSGYYLPSFYALFLTSFTPLPAVHFLAGQQLQTGMATMLVLFWIAVVIFGRRFSDSLVSLLRLRVLRDSLIGQLREARDEAEAANRAKTEFLATIGHEIRTPMHGVLGAVELLLDSPLDDRQSRLARIARDAGESLGHLLDDLLDISRIEAGRIDLVETDFSPADLVEGCAGMFRAGIERKGLALGIEIAPGVPERVAGDPGRLRQILVNLIGNAVKFTATGRIEIEIAPGPPCEADRTVRLRFSVRDSGIGIAPEFHRRIFGKFNRDPHPGVDDPGGSGLGLAIARGLVERMGGSLDFESTPGAGSLFNFEIPFATAHGIEPGTGPDGPPTDGALEGLRLLLVDDSEANRFLLGEMLRRAGAQVEEAESGAAAVERAGAGRYDLLLMDISMPGMDGIEALARIRAARSGGPPAIALTASAVGRDGAPFHERGFAATLIKPVRGRELVDTVRRLAAGVSAGPSVAAGAGEDGISDALRQRFLAEAEERGRRIREALAAGDRAAAGAQAHALAGTAATFGATALADRAGRLEAACGGNPAEDEPALLCALDEAIAALAGSAARPTS